MEPAAAEAQPSAGVPPAGPAADTSGPSGGASADAGPWLLAGGSGEEGPEELPAPGSQAEALALSSPLLLPYERLMLEEVLQVGTSWGPRVAPGWGSEGWRGLDVGRGTGKPRAQAAVGAV